MRLRTVCLAFAALLFVAVAPGFCGSIPALQDWEFNINGTDYYPAGGATLGSVPGLNSSGYDSTTGLGSLVVTFNPGAAGSYYIGAWFFDPVGVPFYNEYGAANGSPASGQTWQIDIPEYDATSANHGTGTILDNLASGTLNNTNSVPGTLTNYLGDCGANTAGAAPNANCNDLVSMAQGFSFTLAAGQEEVITLAFSLSNPGGFSLEDVHPIDGNNPSETDLFYSESAVTKSPSTTPEPASWALFAAGAAFLVAGMRRRLAQR